MRRAISTIYVSFMLCVGAVIATGCFSSTAGTVAASAELVRPIRTGARVPSTVLRDVKGAPFYLRDTCRGQKTVLVFYRGGWCPFCNKQLAGLQQAQPALEKLGYRIVAISPDRPENLRASVGKHHLSYTLVSDSKMEAAKRFGLAFQVDAATLEKYKGYGIDLVKASGEPHQQLPVPAVFLVDTEARITFRYFNPDYATRLDTDALLKAARRPPPERDEYGSY